MVFYLLLFVPSILVRSLVLHREIKNKKDCFITFLTGMGQDLFILFLVLFLSSLSFSMGLIVYFLIQLMMILDAFLYSKAGFRIELSFFSFIKDIPSFWDSGKEKGFIRFIPVMILYLLGSMLLFFRAYFVIDQSMVVLALASLLCGSLLPKKFSYSCGNIVFLQGMWLIKKMIKRKKELRIKSHPHFSPKNEKMIYLTPDYPLLKYTYQFHGKKQFDLKVDKEEKPHVIFLFM